MATTISDAEAEQAQAQVDAVADEFKDAKEEEVESGGTFDVTKEELSILRAELASEYPDDYNYLSDAYMASVASKPYSKDPSVRRPLEYTLEKLKAVMSWREKSGAVEVEDLVDMINSGKIASNATKTAKAKALVNSLNTNSQYFHGLTKDGRPILWIRTSRKFWYPDVEAEINALIILADAGIRAMPKDVTEFVVIADSTSPPPPNPTFMINLLKAFVRGYPDRLHKLHSAPISSIIQFVMKLLLPLMPGRLASKLVLLDVDKMKTTLKDLLLNGEKDIPHFFGGPVNHDRLYPEEAKCPNRGKGSLKFDYYGMKERLQKTVEEYESSRN